MVLHLEGRDHLIETLSAHSDVRSVFPILWQIGYTVNDNISVWADED